jgi:hypothetical protein
LLGDMCCVRRVLHEHGMVPVRCMRMAYWWRWAIEQMLWVIWRLRIDDTGIEVRVLRIVCVKRRCTVGRRRGIYRDCVHGCHRCAACVW